MIPSAGLFLLALLGLLISGECAKTWLKGRRAMQAHRMALAEITAKVEIAKALKPGDGSKLTAQNVPQDLVDAWAEVNEITSD